MKTNVKYVAATTAIAVLSIGVVAVMIAGSIATMKTRALKDDHSVLTQDARYGAEVSVQGIEPIVQEVSCGYAVIEMLSAWDGHRITERDLLDANGSVTTATDAAFCEEAGKRLPQYSIDMRCYQSNSELLRIIHESLERGNPVPLSWAAQYKEGEAESWTLHYSLVTGMDLAHDTITVANPYGYTEAVTVDEFLARTSFEAFEHKPFWMELAFAFGVFEKNAVFVLG